MYLHKCGIWYPCHLWKSSQSYMLFLREVWSFLLFPNFSCLPQICHIPQIQSLALVGHGLLLLSGHWGITATVTVTVAVMFPFFYLFSFYSHAVSFHHVSSSSFPHISFSFHHSSFLEAWLELVMMTAWEVTHFVYFVCKLFYLEKMWMVCIFQFWSALIGFDEVYCTVLSNILIEFDQLQLK